MAPHNRSNSSRKSRKSESPGFLEEGLDIYGDESPPGDAFPDTNYPRNSRPASTSRPSKSSRSSVGRSDLSRPKSSSRKSKFRDHSARQAPVNFPEIEKWGHNNPGFWGGRKNIDEPSDSRDPWRPNDARFSDASGFANFNDLGRSKSSGRHKSKGTKLSKKLPFGEALEQSNRRAKNFERKKFSSGSSFDMTPDLASDGAQKLDQLGSFTIRNESNDNNGADSAIIEFNNKLRSEVADLESKCSQEAGKNAANLTKIQEMAAMEKVLREENLKLRKDLAKSEANVISLNRRFENAKEVKLQAPWKRAASMILDNFRAAASITEDALVKMGGALDRKDEFEKVVEPRTPKKLVFGFNESIELDVIANSLTTYKKNMSMGGDGGKKSGSVKEN